MMSTPSGEERLHARGREWTGSVSDLPNSLRALAMEFAETALANRDSQLSSYLQDHAYTLSEWGDAVEQLYAKLDEGEIVTNAQGVALAGFLRRGFRNAERRVAWANVALGGAGLPDSYLHVRMGDGFEGGIDSEGRVST